MLTKNNQRKWKGDLYCKFPFFFVSFFNQAKSSFPKSPQNSLLRFLWLLAYSKPWSTNKGRMWLTSCLDQSLFITCFISWGRNWGLPSMVVWPFLAITYMQKISIFIGRHKVVVWIGNLIEDFWLPRSSWNSKLFKKLKSLGHGRSTVN